MDSGKFLDQFKDQLKDGNGAQPQPPQQDPNQQYADPNYNYYNYAQYYGGGYPGYDYGAYGGPEAQAYADPNAYGYMPYMPPPGFGAPLPPPPSENIPPRPAGGQEPSRSIWVGNVAPETTETELQFAFQSFGIIDHIKVLPAKNCAFIRYLELDAAIAAYQAMHGQVIHGQQLKVGWGKPEPVARERDDGPPPCRNLWLGNIGPEVTEDRLRDIFGAYGQIEKIRLLPQKGCAFVNFMTLEAAVTAKMQMQGYIIGDRAIKINFGKDSGDPPAAAVPQPPPPPKSPTHAPSALPPLPEEAPPPDAPSPTDPALKLVIDKMAEYVAKNGKTFEMVTLTKYKDNPKFEFLKDPHPFNPYYKLKLWCFQYPHITPNEYRQRKEQEIEATKYGAVPPPVVEYRQETWVAPVSKPTQQQSAPTSTPAPAPAPTPTPAPAYSNVPPSYDTAPPPAPPADDTVNSLARLVDNLVPTKDSIKTVKNFIVARPQTAKDIASYLRARVEHSQEFEAKLNLIYLIHDVLHHTLRDRSSGTQSDAFSDAFAPNLGGILRSTFQGQAPESQEKLIKVMKIWSEKGIYSPSFVSQLDQEMRFIAPPRGDGRESRDNRDRRDFRDNRDTRDNRDGRDSRGPRDSRDNRDKRGGPDDYDRKRGRDKEYDRDPKRRH